MTSSPESVVHVEKSRILDAMSRDIASDLAGEPQTFQSHDFEDSEVVVSLMLVLRDFGGSADH